MKLSISKKRNEKLVDILNHKIFKGYRQIKASKTFDIKKFKFIKIPSWEVEPLEPFHDNYNLQYRKMYLNKGPNVEITTTSEKELLKPKTPKNRIKVGNQASKQKTFITREEDNLSKNTQIRRDNEDEEKKKRIYNKIFLDLSEAEQYSNIPLLPLQRKRKLKNMNGKPLINSENEDDEFNGLTEAQFLYRISHKKNKGKNLEDVNFRHSKGLYKGFVSRQLKDNQKQNYYLTELDLKKNDNKDQETQTDFYNIYKNSNRKVFDQKVNDLTKTSVYDDTGHPTMSSTQPNKEYCRNSNSKKRLKTAFSNKLIKFDECPRFITNQGFLDLQNRNREKFLKLRSIMDCDKDSKNGMFGLYLDNIAYINNHPRSERKYTFSTSKTSTHPY